MNPILPRHEYIPDPEARVWADGRLYIYGSRDLPGVQDYCSDSYKVFSTDDLITWTDHGVSFRGEQVAFCESDILYAPDCVNYRGRYYLFFCLPGGREGVAVSDSPAGPFGEVSPIAGADGLGIDPAVLVDDDGEAYLYWGQNELFAARLSEDLRSILPETLHRDVITHGKHGFHEGASIRKIHGRYYLVYCDGARGRATSLSYAIGDSPFGPFERQGVIIDNTNCDPLSWNIHGSLCEFRGQWFVFYHRSSQGSRYHRRACVEPITIGNDGSIKEVRMTTNGADSPVSVREGVEAWRACSMYGRLQTVTEDGMEFLRSQGDGNTADFRDYFFQGESTLKARVRGKGSFWVNPSCLGSSCLAEIVVDSPGQWITLQQPVLLQLQGPSSLHFYFAAGEVDVERLDFYE